MKKPDRKIKIRPEYHLIVTEGTDTEPAYFGSIQEIVNKDYPEKIQLKVFGMGDNMVSLFEKAKRLAQENPNGYRHVWIVYDTDDFPAEHIDRVVQRCAENGTDMYYVLRPYMDMAIDNAKSLDAINYGKAPSKAAPGTKVYELVERLRPYL